jgi:hypothetical protein
LSNIPRPKLPARKLKRPTADTKFYVGFDWWKESGMDLKTYLYQRLPNNDISNLEIDAEEVDMVDPETGEVRQVDGFEYMLQFYFSQLPDDFASQTSLVDAVFCILLANGNRPMSIRELAERVGRLPEVLLRTLAGNKVYQGIRPIL